MGQVLSLISFRKVYFSSLLFTMAFFASFYFVTRPNDGGEASVYISCGGGILCGILALVLFACLGRTIATSYIERNFDGEEFSFMEILSDSRGYVVNTSLLFFVFALAYNLIIPFIGSAIGGIFQVNLGGFEFNILTLAINYFFIIWLFLGTAEVVSMDANFFETLPITLQFIFNHFLKIIAFVVFILVVHLIFQITLVLTYQFGAMETMPIKVLIFAYLFALCNSYAISFFVSGAAQDEEESDGDEDDDEDEDDE